VWTRRRTNSSSTLSLSITSFHTRPHLARTPHHGRSHLTIPPSRVYTNLPCSARQHPTPNASDIRHSAFRLVSHTAAFHGSSNGCRREPENAIVSGLGLSSDLTNTIVHGLRTSNATPYEPLSGPSFHRHSKHALHTHLISNLS
jgi:hypothetical protein